MEIKHLKTKRNDEKLTEQPLVLSSQQTNCQPNLITAGHLQQIPITMPFVKDQPQILSSLQQLNCQPNSSTATVPLIIPQTPLVRIKNLFVICRDKHDLAIK